MIKGNYKSLKSVCSNILFHCYIFSIYSHQAFYKSLSTCLVCNSTTNQDYKLLFRKCLELLKLVLTCSTNVFACFMFIRSMSPLVTVESRKLNNKLDGLAQPRVLLEDLYPNTRYPISIQHIVDNLESMAVQM